MISFWLQVFSPVCATSCLPVDAGCILMASLVNRLSNCTPRTDNPGHTINTMLHVMQCPGKVQHNAIETRHTTIYNAMEADTQLGHTINTILHVMQQGGIYNALQVDTQLGHTINTAGGDCSLPTIGGSSPGHRVPRLQMLNAAKYKSSATNIYTGIYILLGLSKFLSFAANCPWYIICSYMDLSGPLELFWAFKSHPDYSGVFWAISTILGNFGPK